VQLFLDEDEEYSVTVVDTPGFDDTLRSDTEILAEITNFLAAKYVLEIPLKGIIYLHQIHENRMRGSARHYLEIFRSLCGDHALANITLVTTRWDQISRDELGDALRREQELIDQWWGPMQKHGSHVTQFHGSKGEAEAMVLELVRNRDTVVLDIQRELVDGHKEVGETAAGIQLVRQLQTDARRYKAQLANIKSAIAKAPGGGLKARSLYEQKEEVERELEKLENNQKGMRTKVGDNIKEKVSKEKSRRWEVLSTGVSVFVAVLSITLTIVKFVAL